MPTHTTALGARERRPAPHRHRIGQLGELSRRYGAARSGDAVAGEESTVEVRRQAAQVIAGVVG
jgi:hypothetical protein